MMTAPILDNDGRAVIHNTETGQVLTCSVPTAIENVTISKGVWAHGPAPEGTPVYVPQDTPPAPVIPLKEEGVLPLPNEDLAAQLAAMEQRALAAEAQVARLTAALAGDELALARTTPGDSDAKQDAINQETDAGNAAAGIQVTGTWANEANTEAKADLTAAQIAALDNDKDGKAGGSTPKAGRSPEEEAERAALFAEFKALGIKVFAGLPTDKLRAKMAEAKAA